MSSLPPNPSSSPHSKKTTRLGRGTLLIANPEIDIGIFFRSVLVVCEHSPAGSFALIINKPIDVELPEELLSSQEITNPKAHIRAGGPLQPSQMMLLHTKRPAEATEGMANQNMESQGMESQSLEICEGVYLGGDVEFLKEAVNSSDGPYVYLCFGYMGWTAGMLEREILNNDWFLYPASSRLIFEVPAEKLWQTVLREMGGKYATLSMIPEDPSLN